MIKSILKSILNIIRYFFSGNNSKFFEKLAGSELLPEQVDGYVEKYGDPVVKEFFVYNTDNIAPLVNDNDVILDIGCGSGRYLKWFQETKNNIHLYGIDISANTINNYTKKNVGTAQLAIGNFAHHNPWEEEKFDLIYAITMLEYIPFFNLKAFLMNILGALKKDGILYIQFPSGENCFDLIKNLGYTRYPVNYIENKLKQVGFSVVESKIDNNRPYLGAFIIAKK